MGVVIAAASLTHSLTRTHIPTSRRYGDEAACRKLLQRSVNSASDDPECVCEALMQFEREVGTLESFELAQERCRAQIKRVGERREKVCVRESVYVCVCMLECEGVALCVCRPGS